jgi:glyoxylase-like metal-dependent hydrolase (beta-lactamase superfamily II)
VKLKEIIGEKFHVPVKYVVYTHGHFDHIGGGQIFQNAGAQIVAQKNVLEPIIGERLPTALPNIVFDQEMALNIGGESLLLHHAPPSHSDSMTLVYFPKYKALQCTDICGSDSLPYGELPDFYYDGWVETLLWIQHLDIRWIDDGHHKLATKDQEKQLLQYFQELHNQVLDFVRRGESWEQIYHDVQFKDVYKKWTDFDSYHASNARGMYEWISLHRRGVW